MYYAMFIVLLATVTVVLSRKVENILNNMIWFS